MTTRRRKPRHFLYHDTDVSESYLAHFAGGLPEGASRANRNEESEHRDYGVASGGSGASLEETERFRPTSVSMFDLLYKELDEEVDGEKILVHIDSLDENRWQDLGNDDIVEITGVVKIPEVVKAMEVVKGIDRFLPTFEALGASGQIPMNEEDREAMVGMGMLSEIAGSEESNSTVVVVEPAGSPGYRFVARLDNQFIHGDQTNLEGEAKVLGKVQRKLEEGDQPIGIEQLLPGLESFRGLRDLASEEESSSDDDIAIGYPAATLIPVAIYR